MPNEVDLTLVANNKEYLDSLTEAQKAQTQFFNAHKAGTEQMQTNTDKLIGKIDDLSDANQDYLNKFKKGATEQKGYIEDITNSIKEWEQARAKSTDVKEIEKYNRKIAEGRKDLDNYYKAGIEGAKKQESAVTKLRGAFFKFTALIGGSYAILRGWNKLVETSGTLSDKLQEYIQGARSGLIAFNNALTTGNFSNFIDNMKQAIQAGKEYAQVMDELEDRRKALGFQEADARVRYVQLMNIIRNVNKTESERRIAAEELIKMEDELLTKRTEINEKTYKATLSRISKERGLTEDLTEAYIKQDDARLRQLNEFALAYEKKYEAIIKATQGTDSGALAYQKSQIKALEKNDPFGAYMFNQLKSLKNITDAQRQELLSTYEALAADKAEFAQKTGKAQRVQDMLDANGNKEKVKDEKKTGEDILKIREEFYRMIQELDKRYRDAQIESLTGIERIDAEEKFAIEELKLFEDSLKAKGEITEDQANKINAIRESIMNKANMERVNFYTQESLQEAANNRKLIDLQLQKAEDSIDLTDFEEEEKLKLKIEAYKKALEMLSMSGDDESKAMAENIKRSIAFMEKDLKNIKPPEVEIFDKLKTDFYEAIGIDTKSKEGQDQIRGIETFTNSMLGSISTILGAEQELAAERTRLAEQRLDELENQLSEEEDLQEQGLANNVSTVKKQIEETKREKEAAQEQEAKLAKAQMALDTVSQISSLITASANIWKATSKIPPPLGQILAIAAIGTMFAFMAQAKIKAAQAAKMEEGGYIDEYGVIHGKRHSQGGEPLNKHVEVESGEGVGVFNRSATSYYGGQLPKWVSSINRREFPKFNIRPEVKISNNPTLDTSKMNGELKAIRSGIDSLNKNMSTSTSYVGTTRIEKRKNVTRIIHAQK